MRLALDITKDVREIINTYLTGVRPPSNDNVMALCPFHDDRSASFAMSLTTGLYYCHACHATGNLYTFFRDLGVSRDIVNQKYRVVLEELKKCKAPLPDGTRPGIFNTKDIPDSFLGLLDRVHPSLLVAGFSEEALRSFDVGWDTIHDRITYPIRDIDGKLVALSGRAIQKGVKPRYKIYDKEYEAWDLPARYGWSRAPYLYNAHRVIPALVKHNPPEIDIVVVEGFKAAIWLWQAGIKNVVALLGSEATWAQLWQLQWVGGTTYLFLDNNAAGRLGTLSTGHALLKEKPSVKVIEYPDRLFFDYDAQPDCLTEEEVFCQYMDAQPFYSWLHSYVTRVEANEPGV